MFLDSRFLGTRFLGACCLGLGLWSFWVRGFGFLGSTAWHPTPSVSLGDFCFFHIGNHEPTHFIGGNRRGILAEIVLRAKTCPDSVSHLQGSEMGVVWGLKSSRTLSRPRPCSLSPLRRPRTHSRGKRLSIKMEKTRAFRHEGGSTAPNRVRELRQRRWPPNQEIHRPLPNVKRNSPQTP